MTIYTIRATRQVSYEFCVTADSERGAREEIAIIGQGGTIEEYAYDWEPLKITEIDEESE
jgi:hypothetical protein